MTHIITHGADVCFPLVNKISEKHINQTATFNQCLKGVYPHETMHINFRKFALGVHKRAMNLPTLAELGRVPLSIKIIAQTISYWKYKPE